MIKIKKLTLKPWLGRSVGWSIVLHIKKVAGLIPDQGTYLGCRFDPLSRHILSVCLSLKSINISSGEDLKKRINIVTILLTIEFI